MDWTGPCAGRCRARCFWAVGGIRLFAHQPPVVGHVGRPRGVAQRDAAALSRVDHEVTQLLRRELVGVDGRQDRNLAQRGCPQPVNLVGGGFHRSHRSRRRFAVHRVPEGRGVRDRLAGDGSPWPRSACPRSLPDLSPCGPPTSWRSGWSTPGTVRDSRDDRQSAVQATPRSRRPRTGGTDPQRQRNLVSQRLVDERDSSATDR